MKKLFVTIVAVLIGFNAGPWFAVGWVLLFILLNAMFSKSDD